MIVSGTFFKSVANIYPSEIHFERALRGLKAIKHDSKIKNIRNANRKFAAISLDTLMKALTVPLTQLLDIYNSKVKNLHPYEVRS